MQLHQQHQLLLLVLHIKLPKMALGNPHLRQLKLQPMNRWQKKTVEQARTCKLKLLAVLLQPLMVHVTIRAILEAARSCLQVPVVQVELGEGENCIQLLGGTRMNLLAQPKRLAHQVKVFLLLMSLLVQSGKDLEASM